MMGGGWNLVWIKGFRYAFEILNLKRTMDNEYVEDSTDIESMPDIPPRRSSKKAKHLSDSWMLSQRQVEPQTDGSELEDFIMEVPKIIPSVKVNSYNSKCSVTENKGKKGKKKSVPVQVVQDDDDTDDEHIDITAKDLQDIIKEALDSRGKQKLFLKTHDTSIVYRSQGINKDDNDDDSDDTDCSDVDVSMMDYYAIRHANQPTIHFKNVKRTSVYKNFVEQDHDPDTEEEPDSFPVSKQDDANDSDVSELEVNMKDYYVIRHETAPKFVAGPFEIDFGNTIHSSTLKKQKLAKISLSFGKEIEGTTDDEELSCAKDDLMTYQEYQHANRTNADLRKYQHDSMICQGGSKGQIESGSEEDSEEESCESEPSNTDSMPTESNMEDLSNMMVRPKGKPPIIRLIEIEGCQGAIGVVCEPKSPTRDEVHGVRFIEEIQDISEQTESIIEDDLSGAMLSKIDNPATDNEDISDLEYDHHHDQPSKYALPEIKKTIKSIKTSKDGKMTKSTENLVKLDEPVSLIQFVEEIENLSESDVCDWSEEEVKIVRRLSGDFGRTKKLLELNPELKENGISSRPQKPSKSSKDDGKLKIDDNVSLTQFVQEVEKLSESDVSDWPEEEVKIVRRLSGDFGRYNNHLLTTPELPKKPKKTGRNRRRGKKKSAKSDGGIGQNNVVP